MFSTLDEMAERDGLGKIKTSGDASISVSRLLEPRAGHTQAAVRISRQGIVPFKELASMPRGRYLQSQW